MPSACMKSTTIYTPPPFNYPAIGKVYIDYLYTDYPDRVVITSRILLSISPRIGDQINSIELYDGSTWTIYTTTYSGKPTTTHAASTTAETIGVASDLQSLTVYKTHSAINYNITAYYSGCKVKTVYTKQSTADTMYGSVTEALPQIPAKTHYTVAYNVNGGTGGPTTSSTKWYNETLTLSTTAPTRTGFKFKGWATSSTGSAVYAAGGSYTANAAATLYAVWEARNERITVVLTWGFTPNDLDSHVEGQKSNGTTFHAYYSNKVGSDIDGSTIASLDNDITKGLGPETFTINTLGGKNYYYYVHNYSGSGRFGNAVVTVTSPSLGTITYYSNEAPGNGRYWNVFAYKDGRIVTRQTFSYSPELNY